MELSRAVPIHFYDTRTHAIACGKRAGEHRSTKHARNVTCDACVGLLAERTTGGGHARDDAPANVAAP